MEQGGDQVGFELFVFLIICIGIDDCVDNCACVDDLDGLGHLINLFSLIKASREFIRDDVMSFIM